MHDERSKECIIHEPIEQHELTHLHHDNSLFILGTRTTYTSFT